jgi:hypothetical protein
LTPTSICSLLLDMDDDLPTALLRVLVPAIVGSFGTAYVHERTGRDPGIGGTIGLLVGGIGTWWALVSLWSWLVYTKQPIRVMNPRKRWYSWWRFW